MSEIINLRQKRKEKKRVLKEKQAEQNRQKFGRSKAEKETTQKIEGQKKQHIDGHLLDKKDK